jgi:hypothetical protein
MKEEKLTFLTSWVGRYLVTSYLGKVDMKKNALMR